MPSERAAEHFAIEPEASSALVLARVLAKGGDPQPQRQLAVQLLNRFGSLEALLNAGREALLAIPPLTAEDVALLEAIGHCIGMIDTDKGQRRAPIIESLESLGAYILTTDLRLPTSGVSLRLIMIDRSHMIVGDADLDVSCSASHLARDVVVKVLEHGAAGVVLMWMQASTSCDVASQLRGNAQLVGVALGRLEVELLDCALVTSFGIRRLSVPTPPGHELL